MCSKNKGLLISLNKHLIYLTHEATRAVFKLKLYFQIQTKMAPEREVYLAKFMLPDGWFTLEGSVSWSSPGQFWLPSYSTSIATFVTSVSSVWKIFGGVRKLTEMDFSQTVSRNIPSWEG